MQRVPSSIDDEPEAPEGQTVGIVAVALVTDDPACSPARLHSATTTAARAADPQALVQKEGDGVVALLGLAASRASNEHLALGEWLRQRVAAVTGVVVSAGVSNPLSPRDTRQIGFACDLARAALLAGRAIRGPGHATDLSELGPRAIPALASLNLGLKLYCQQAIWPLLKYDARRQGRLIPTLEAYFAAAQQATEAARKLGEHRNTIHYRLNLVERLTGRSLRDPDDVLCLMLGIKLHGEDDVEPQIEQ